MGYCCCCLVKLPSKEAVPSRSAAGSCCLPEKRRLSFMLSGEWEEDRKLFLDSG